MRPEDELPILYQDDSIAIIEKPQGLITHRTQFSSDRDSVVDRLKAQFSRPLHPVHRLDRPTSGILVCAFTPAAASALGRAFSENGVHKEYIAVVRGYTEREGLIDRPLKKDGEGIEQEAHSAYCRLKILEIPVKNNRYETSRYSLVRVTPKTGRFHQIRRHLSGIGHPVIGDTSHGDLRHNKIARDYWGNERLLLHSCSIRFNHPLSGEPFVFSSPLPDDMSVIADSFYSAP